MRDAETEVLEAVYRFALALDTRDWDAYRAGFTDEVDVDYSSYRPGSAGRMSADAWVARAARLFPGLDGTSHTITNPLVEVTTDTARVRSYVRADHVLGARCYTLGGSYEHRLVAAPGGWLICAVTLTVRWETGEREVLAEAVVSG